MIVKLAAAAVVLAAASTNINLHDSNVSYKDARAACEGTLGAVSFSAGHARVVGAPGVDAHETSGREATVDVQFHDPRRHKGARISMNQRERTVSGKHLRVALHGSVACVLPD